MRKKAWTITIFIKESARDVLSKLKKYFKPHVALRPLKELSEVKPSDLIIISASDNTHEFASYHVVICEKLLADIHERILEEYEYRHDYYYLKNSLSKILGGGKTHELTTVFVGSSYGAYGIELEYLPNIVNLCSPSEDLYYSIALVKEACKRSRKVRNIVLIAGYWLFWFDLSLTQNSFEQQRVSKTFFPLFGDSHNRILVSPMEHKPYESNMIDVNKIVENHSWDDYKNGNFSLLRPRSNYANRNWIDKSRLWPELTNDERIQAGHNHADSHNNNVKHLATFKENCVLYREFVNQCASAGKRIMIIVPPATRYYREHLSPRFKESFYDICGCSGNAIQIHDWFDDPDFDDDVDFNDADHLGDSGAKKFSMKLAALMVNI